MSKLFQVSVSNGEGNVVINSTKDLTEATQLALALHQSSAKDVVVDVFSDCPEEGSGLQHLVHLIKK